ncbi:hypothetical protein BGZ83_000254 [Gryganskiella cystojenkinii]|nr:hypothetical protein BGZ83_000254 [Gryganskiella cystojenkinii]
MSVNKAVLQLSGVEVGNGEAKRAGAYEREVEIQLRQNIKIGKSMHLVQYLRTTNRNPVLSCPYMIAAHAFESKSKNADKAAFHSPERESELLEWLKLVMHSPTKLKPVKEHVETSKPDNKRFQRLMEEAMADTFKDFSDDDDHDKVIDNEEEDEDD